ncbi:uncharacterized protein scimp [Aulostomus maculatus]
MSGTTPMTVLRDYFWLWVICGMLLVSLVISLIFYFINRFLSQEDKHRIAHLNKGSFFHVQENKYMERNTEAENPRLPSRVQFLAAQSYENLAEGPDYLQALADPPNYVHSQSLGEQPDYVKVEDEEEPPPLASPYQPPDPPADESGEDYDDIDQDENQAEEDYDDVG